MEQLAETPKGEAGDDASSLTAHLLLTHLTKLYVASATLRQISPSGEDSATVACLVEGVRAGTAGARTALAHPLLDSTQLRSTVARVVSAAALLTGYWERHAHDVRLELFEVIERETAAACDGLVAIVRARHAP